MAGLVPAMTSLARKPNPVGYILSQALKLLPFLSPWLAFPGDLAGIFSGFSRHFLGGCPHLPRHFLGIAITFMPFFKDLRD
jgi:hypothetical protein